MACLRGTAAQAIRTPGAPRRAGQGGDGVQRHHTPLRPPCCLHGTAAQAARTPGTLPGRTGRVGMVSTRRPPPPRTRDRRIRHAGALTGPYGIVKITGCFTGLRDDRRDTQAANGGRL